MKLLGLDVGEKRIGTARADSSVRIAVPLGVVLADGSEIAAIVRLIKMHNIDVVVVGMPRNLQGAKTQQSAYTEKFVKELTQVLATVRPNEKQIRIFYQDESLTSVQAKQNLANKKGGIHKGDVDTEAAVLILQDFLENLSRRLSQKKSTSLAPTPPITKNYRLNNQRTNSAAKPNPGPYQNMALTATPPAERPPEPKKSPSAVSSLDTENIPKDKLNTKKKPEKLELEPEREEPLPFRTKPRFSSHKESSRKKWLIIRIISVTLVSILLIFFLVKSVYSFLLTPIVPKDTCSSDSVATEEQIAQCAPKTLEIPEGTSPAKIAAMLKEADLIRNEFAMKIYLKLSDSASELKSGNYKFLPTSSVPELVEELKKGGTAPITFRFTVLPGETLADVKKRLIQYNYSEEEIDAAFAKEYNHPVLVDKPKEASLEGYLFGETYEFYITDSVETILERMMTELYTVVERNGLRDKFAKMGLTLHEGITLASVVQKEAGTLGKEDQKTVAQVFLSRLDLGIPLGSDVTVKYALDQIDPERKTYTDNASALEVESCYNTRKNPGLPCGPISNPGAIVLISTANPSDTSYLYFLTGDDSLMYYSNTESEHNQNVLDHCQKLCATQL